MEPKNHHGIRTPAWVKCWAGCACLALGTAGFGQVAQPEGTFPRMHGHHQQTAQAPIPNQPAPAPTPSPVPTSAPSMLDRPPQSAKIDLGAGHLAIQADNSSLMDILHQVAAASGMTVEGLGQDQRIFGSYGPGNPPDVLLALLHGSGYNIVMLGATPTGVPKQLTLSPRGAAGPSSGPNRLQQPRQDEDNDDEVQAQPVLIDPATQQQQQQPTPPQGPPGGVRTPQQMLQELQQMRQQQQQQQQQPQPQQ